MHFPFIISLVHRSVVCSVLRPPSTSRCQYFGADEIFSAPASLILFRHFLSNFRLRQYRAFTSVVSIPVPSRPNLFRGVISLGTHSVLSDPFRPVLFVQFFSPRQFHSACSSSFPSRFVSASVLNPSSPLLLSCAIYFLRPTTPSRPPRAAPRSAPHVLLPCDRQVRQQREAGLHTGKTSPLRTTHQGSEKICKCKKSNIKLIPAAARGVRGEGGREWVALMYKDGTSWFLSMA